MPLRPWTDPRLARKPGTVPLDLSDWLIRCERFDEEIAARNRLLDVVRETVIGAMPGSEKAQSELENAVGDWLGGEALPPDPQPLGRIGRAVQEDFCILERDPDGSAYRLTAAVLCFPSRWSLAEKLGEPLTAIHDPVPDYDAGLARRVDRLFERIRPDTPLWRANWTVHPTDELHQPSGDSRADEPADGPLFLRIERQTFRRLPRSGAVVFGIRTFIEPLYHITGAEAVSLGEALAALDPDEIAYRGGPALHRAALAQLACSS